MSYAAQEKQGVGATQDLKQKISSVNTKLKELSHSLAKLGLCKKCATHNEALIKGISKNVIDLLYETKPSN